jgi:cobalt/nickel transport system permease protein
MHIAEGIITGPPVLAYTGAAVALVAWGTSRMKKFIREAPQRKPLLGMAAALIFFVSLLPLPAFTGTTTHPCGTPFIGILLGPAIGTALAAVSLLLQAAFFAHGGFATWGANVIALGFFGCFFGWATFRLARLLKLPLWAAGCAAGFVGDIMVYAASGMILGITLSTGPHPQFSLEGYLTAIYAAYLPTQLPIAIGETLMTGLALHYAFKQRPDVLRELNIISDTQRPRKTAPVALILAALLLSPVIAPVQSHAADATKMEKQSTAMSGMDEAVNERMAEAAGLPAGSPFLDLESMGELWNTLLLLAGGVCGFILGRRWDHLWGSRRPSETSETGPLTQ